MIRYQTTTRSDGIAPGVIARCSRCGWREHALTPEGARRVGEHHNGTAHRSRLQIN